MRPEPTSPTIRPMPAAGYVTRRLDTRAWLLWVTTAAVLALIIRNPLYAMILILAATVVQTAWSEADGGLQLPMWRLALLIVTISAVYNGLLVHLGQTILWRLPAGWPLLGGPITLEAIVYGLSTGLVLLSLLAVFLAFNRIVPLPELVRLTPAALHDLALVVLIAITYVPEMIQQLGRVREAQAIRGHRLRGLRDWRPIVIPLLVGGLERSMGLAEAMIARGYGATADREQRPHIRIGLVVGLALALGGWTLAFWWGWPGWLLLATGMALLVVLLWHNGRRFPRTRYRERRWTWNDSILAGTALIPLLVLTLPGVARSSLIYNPYPLLQPPPFDPLIGLALMSLALPALLRPAQSGRGGLGSGRNVNL